MIMKRLLLLACFPTFMMGCSGSQGNGEASVPEKYTDLHYRDSALLADGMIYYGNDPSGEAFDDMYYAFLSSENENEEASQKALQDFKNQLAGLSKDQRNFLKYVFNDYADLAEMANYAYKDSEVEIPEGWVDMGDGDSKLAGIIQKYSVSGLKCSLMAKGDRRVLVFAGTDFPSNWTNPEQVMDFILDAYEDVDGALNSDASQVAFAKKLVDELLAQGYVTKTNLEFAGHSLGGRLSSVMAAQYGCPAVIFNAAGVSPEMYEKYEAARNNAGEAWRGYVVDVIAANDPLTCAQKYMSGISDPFVSTAAKALDVDDKTLDGLLSLGLGVVDAVAQNVSDGSSVMASIKGFAGIVDDYYERDYRALGAKMPVREDLAGHGIKELALALRVRAELCD
jgi:pimeloyl-ACP methyl ester carboxylesterase